MWKNNGFLKIFEAKNYGFFQKVYNYFFVKLNFYIPLFFSNTRKGRFKKSISTTECKIFVTFNFNWNV